MNYLEKFSDLLHTLQDDTTRRVLFASFGEPASEDVVERIKKTFFHGRESPVLDFYKQLNGFTIIWMYADHPAPDLPEFDPLLFIKKDARFDGVINFLPMEQVFDPETWKDTVWFDNDVSSELTFAGVETTNDQVRRQLLLLDLFSTDMSMALHVQPANDYMLLLQDYHIDYKSSLLTTFTDYLDFVISAKGLVRARYQVFNQLNGYKQPLISANELIKKI